MESSSARARNGQWIASAILAIALAALPAYAANNCPWMNEATASGLLGAEATGNFTAALPSRPANCVFLDISPGATRTLTITVGFRGDSQARMRELLGECHGAASAMQAIGNEAEQCDIVQPRKLRGELVVGRVRDQVFSITLSTTMKNDPVLRPEELQNRIATAAEQVAGSLF